MRTRPARSLLTAAAVGLAVALVVGVTCSYATLRASLMDWIRRWNGAADLAVSLEQDAPDPASLIRRVSAVPGVAGVEPRVSFLRDPVLLGVEGPGAPDPVAVVLQSVHAAPDGSAPDGLRTAGGRLPSADETDAVALDAGTAKSLRVAVGGTVRFVPAWIGKPYERPARRLRVTGIIDIAPAPSGDPAKPATRVPAGRVLAGIDTIRALATEPGVVHLWAVRLRPGLTDAQRADTLAAVHSAIGVEGEVLDVAAAAAAGELPPPTGGVLVRTWWHQRDFGAVADDLSRRFGTDPPTLRLSHYPFPVSATPTPPQSRPEAGGGRPLAGSSGAGQELVRIVGLAGSHEDSSDSDVGALLEGRLPAPAGSGTVALSASAAGRLGVAVGGELHLPDPYPGLDGSRPALTARVVGLLSDPPGGKVPVMVATLADAQAWLSDPGRVESVTFRPPADPTGRRQGDLRAELERTGAGRGTVVLHGCRRVEVQLALSRSPAEVAGLLEPLTTAEALQGPGAGWSADLFYPTAPVTIRRPAGAAPLPDGRPDDEHRILLLGRAVSGATASAPGVASTTVGPWDGMKLVAGRFPKDDADEGVVLDRATAARIGVGVGDRVTLPEMWAGTPYVRPTTTVTVIGLVEAAGHLLPAPPAEPRPGEAVTEPTIGLGIGALPPVQRWSSAAGKVNRIRIRFAATATDTAVEGALRTLAGRLAPDDRHFPVEGRWGQRLATPLRGRRLGADLQRVPGVAVAAPRLFLLSRFLAVATDAKPEGVRVQAMGIDPADGGDVLPVSARVPALLAGRVPRAGERGVILLDQPSADALKVRPGDRVRLPAVKDGPKVLRPDAEADVIGIFAPAVIADAKGFGACAAPLADVQSWIPAPGAVNRIDVVFDPDIDPGRRAAVEAMASVAVGTAGRVQSWAGRAEQIDRNLGIVRIGVRLLSAAAMLTAVFIVLNTLSINLLERVRRLGLLRCLGMTRGQAAGLVVAEGLLLAAVGVVTGVPLGLVVWRVLMDAVGGDMVVPTVSVDGVVLAAAGGFGAALAASAWPALKAWRVSPAAAVQSLGADAEPPGMRGAAAGVALLALHAAVLLAIRDPAGKLWFHLTAGLVMVFVGWFLLTPAAVLVLGPAVSRAMRLPWLIAGGGAPVRLVDNSLAQQRRSLARAVCALMVGCALVTAISTDADSIVRGLAAKMPRNMPQVYAIGPGSYAEDLAFGYYRANRERVDAARRNETFDEADLELAELVRFPTVERSWEPFREAWRVINRVPADGPGSTLPGTAAPAPTPQPSSTSPAPRQTTGTPAHVTASAEPPGLAEIYVQDVELTRAMHAADGLVPRDAALIAVDPDPEQGFFSMIDVTFLRGDRATALRRLAEGGAALLPKSLQAGQGLDVGHVFEVNLDPASPEKTKRFEVVGIVELGVLEVLFLYLDPMAGPDSLTAGVFLVGKRDAVAKLDARGLRDKRYFYKSNAALIPQKVVMGRYAGGVDHRAALPKLRAAGRDLVVDSVGDLLDRLHDDFRMITAMVLSAGWITLAVASLGVANVLLMKVLRQQRQLGVLRALGAGRMQVAAIVLIEAGAVGLLGAGLGAAMGVHLAFIGRHLTGAVFGLEYDVVIPVSVMVITPGVAVGMCLLAGAAAARRAARTPIPEALAPTA